MLREAGVEMGDEEDLRYSIQYAYSFPPTIITSENFYCLLRACNINLVYSC